MSETGFLTAEDDVGFRADLYIAAMGRSGSTYLANCLTTPPSRWVFNEPWFVSGALSKNLRDRAEAFGWPSDNPSWWLPPDRRNAEGMRDRYRTFLLPHIARLDRWGVKEVRGDFHVPTIRTIRPAHIIVLVRDIRQVVLSLLEKSIRQNAMETHGREWITQYCGAAAKVLVDLASDGSDGRMRVVRYEDLIRDESERRRIEAWLDWPMGGDPSHGLAAYGRGYEVERQLGSEGAAKRLLPSDAEAIVDEIAGRQRAYQSLFGY